MTYGLSASAGTVHQLSGHQLSGHEVSGREVSGDGLLDTAEFEVDAPIGTEVVVRWHAPLGGAVGYWTSRVGSPKSLPADWSAPVSASLTAEVPAGLLFDAESRCTHAFAASETVRTVAFAAGVSEERSRIEASLSFVAGHQPCRVRLYPAGAPYEDVLADIASWWAQDEQQDEQLDGTASLAAELPPAATEPVYSTWYNMHQQLEQSVLDDELSLAARLGMRSVIIDDGWQTSDDQRGYAFTGDWRVAPTRFPDLAAHVDRAHGLGLAELLWIALPFVGPESDAASSYEHLLLPDDGRMARLWDVRLPAARAHVAGICRRLVADYHLDGLKIDFIDQWSSYPSSPPRESADTDDYSVGVDRLLAAIVTALKAEVAEPLIEFRQRYIGPRMLRYGNLFRAGDCPADGYSNRVSTVDLRHLIKDRAVHADMIMWSVSEPAEQAAEQLLCSAFAVPQISMLLSELPGDHEAMLRNYLTWWSANRDVLLGGQVRAPRPDLGYPVVSAVGERATVVVGYAPHSVIPVQPGRRSVLANATGRADVVAELSSPAQVTDVTDCFGQPYPEASVPLTAGLHRLPLPRGGSCVITG